MLRMTASTATIVLFLSGLAVDALQTDIGKIPSLERIESRSRKNFMQDLLRKHIRPHRQLEDGVNNYYYEYEEGYEYNYNNYNADDQQNSWYKEDINWANLGFKITDMSLKYVGCSAIQTYDDDKAASGYTDSVLKSQRFAIFRLCPSDTCSTRRVNGCTKNFGEYVLEMDSFLSGIVKYNRQRYWRECHYCERCNALESFGQAMEKLAAKQQTYYNKMDEYIQDKYKNNFNDDNYNYNGGNRQLNDNYNYNYNQGNNWNGYNYDDLEEEFQEIFGTYDMYEHIQSIWQDDWSENWLNYDWRNLPYCSTEDLKACYDSSTQCQQTYYENVEDEEDVDEDQQAINAFSTCIQVQRGYYVAPHCGSDGFTINLGVYSDATCDTYVSRLTVADLIGEEIESVFDFFPEDCVSCEQRREEAMFNNFVTEYEDLDNYDTWIDEKFDDYWEYVTAYIQNDGYQNNNNNGNNYYNNNNNYNNPYFTQEYYNFYGTYYNQNNNYNNNDNRYNVKEKYGYYYDRSSLYTNDEDSGGLVGFYTYSYQVNAMENNGVNEQYAMYRVSDLCGVLYEYSAKCNKNMNGGGNDDFASLYTSEQQLQDEDLVCIFAENLRKHRYNERGEVELRGTLDFHQLSWSSSQDLSQLYARAGFDVVYIIGVCISIAACGVMLIWASYLHRRLVESNIPWRPKRGRYGNPTDIETQNSGVLMGRSTTIPRTPAAKQNLL